MQADTINPEILASQLVQAPLSSIASAIIRDWKSLKTSGQYALPYVSAMLRLGDLSSSYGADSAQTIILYFLSNAAGWRGPVARVVKAELNRRIMEA